MSRSYKKNVIVKDKYRSYQKKGNKDLRRIAKERLKKGEDELPLKKNEVVNQYDVTDWRMKPKKSDDWYDKAKRK